MMRRMLDYLLLFLVVHPFIEHLVNMHCCVVLHNKHCAPFAIIHNNKHSGIVFLWVITHTIQHKGVLITLASA